MRDTELVSGIDVVYGVYTVLILNLNNMKAYLTYRNIVDTITADIVETEFEVLPKEGDELILDDATHEKLSSIVIKHYEYLNEYKSISTRMAHIAEVNKMNQADGYDKQPMMRINKTGDIIVMDRFFNTVGNIKYIQINSKFYPLIKLCDWAKYHNN